MPRLFLLLFLTFLCFSTARAQELQLNYTYLVNEAATNLNADHQGENDTFSLTIPYKLFKQTFFTGLRYENDHFYDQFHNEFSAKYITLGLGPRFTFWKNFTYDVGFFIGFLTRSEVKMIRDYFPNRLLQESKLKSIQRLSYNINIFSNIAISLHGEMHYHFNDFIQDLNGQAGYQVSYELGYGLIYRFGK